MKNIRVENLRKSTGMKQLLEDVSFTISEGEHVGLIGQNGSGKSTLMSIIAGKDTAESGDIIKSKDFRMAYLEQNPSFPEEISVFDAIYQSDHPKLKLVRDYEEALENLQKNPNSSEYVRNFEILEQRMTQEDAWQMEVQIKTILTKLGVGDLERRIGSLSGGQKKRVGLAKVLIDQPDLLLLDEPTNHLDMNTIQWLEDYLAQYKGALLLVTHDRYFLERVVTHMFELSNGNIERYVGNYQSYLEQRSQREEIALRMTQKQKQLYLSELQWMRQGAKARTTKQQARIQRFESLESEVQQNQTKQELEINLDQKRIGKRVFHMEQVSLSIAGLTIISNLDWIIQANDRIGIVGDNGVGKSTFLNALASQREFDSGNFTVGETVRIAYYKQMDDDIPGDKQLAQYLREYAEEVKQKNGEVASVAELLETFLFPRQMHSAQIKTLSGGERRRLYLLKLLMTKPNVLLLDEPTNDLDIDTLTVLENYISEFKGAVITVSHDRYFLDKVADFLVDIKGQGLLDSFRGTMSDYLEVQAKEEKKKANAEQKLSTQNKEEMAEVSPKVKKKKLSYHEQKEWDGLEDKIQVLEDQLEHLQNQMLANQSDFTKLQVLQEESSQVETEIEGLYSRWEELAAIIEA